MELKHVEGRVIIEINIEGKNSHTFSDGLTIRIERQYNNLNRRETEPVNATVISGDNITSGTQILIHPNAIIESNRIYNFRKLSGKDSGDIRYYSIPEEQCFIWLDGEKWKPLKPYETALRLFKPYTGILKGIEPTKIKDVLYVTSGELKGKVVKTLKSCDYEVIFQGTNGQEQRIIRFRPFGDEKTKREEEAIAILNDLTEQVNNGELLVGISVSDMKSLNENAFHRV